MSEIQSPERISGKASQEATRLNSLLKNNDLITTQNERDEIRFIEDRVGKDIADAVKTPSNISPQQILSTALRPLFLEGSYRSFEIEQDRIMAEAKGKGRNFLQNTSRWFTSTVGKTFESTYMGVSHAAEALLNAGGKKLGKEDWGSNNMGSLMKLTGDIFSDSEKYGSEESIKSELRSRIISTIMSGRAKIENKKLGVNIDTDLLTGEGAQLALALSEFGPFNKNSDQVLETVKYSDQPKFASKLDYVLEKLYKQIEVARFNEAQINGIEQSIEAELLKDIVQIQDKLKSSGTTGVREGFNLAAFGAGLALGTVKTTVNLVKTAAGSNLGEKRRLEIITESVVESPEFLNVKNKIQEQLKSGALNQESADLLETQVLNKIAYNSYLEVVKEAMKVNKETTASLTMGGVAGFVNNAVNQGFAVSDIKALAGYGVPEQELQQLIISNKQEQAKFKPEELGEGALALYNSVEKVSIIPTNGTAEFAEKLRQRQIEITDSAAKVTGNLVVELGKQVRDCSTTMVASTPYIAGAGALTYGVTGGNFGFSVNKADVTGGLFQENNLIQSRFDKGLTLNGGDMTVGEQFTNAGFNLLARANGTGNMFNMLSMPLTAIDNITGRHIQGGISSGIENVKTAGSRVGEFSARVASATWMDVQKSVVQTFTSDGKAYPSEINGTLPQPAKANFGDTLAQVAGNVANGGTDNFKSGDTVKLQVGGSALDGKVLGRVGGDDNVKGAAVIRPNLEGVTVKETIEAGNIIPKLYDANGNEIKTTFRTAYLMKDDGSGNVATDAKGNKVVVFVTDGDIAGAKQLSGKTISSSPTVRADNNTAVNPAVKPEVIPQNTAKPDVKNNVVPSNLSGNFRLTGGGENGLANRLMQAGLAVEKNGGVFITQPTSININGRNIVIPVGQYSALTIANAARISDTSIQGLNNNPVAVSFGSASPDLTTQPKPVEVKSQVTSDFNSAKLNQNSGSLAGNLLNGKATIENSNVNADRINGSKNNSGFAALNDLRNRAGDVFQTTFKPASVEPAPSASAKPVEGNKDNVGGLRINVGNTGTNFNIYNNADLAATIGNGNYNSGISRQVLQEVVRQSNLADLQSRGTVQRLAYLAENKLPLPPELKGLTLSSGAKADSVYEGFVQNPADAKEVLKGVSSNAGAAVNIATEDKGSFMVMPVPNGLMVNAQRSWNNLVQTITVSSMTTSSGDPTIALPNNGKDIASNNGVKVENGIITARMGVDFKPLSKISLNMGNGINAVIDATQFPKLMEQLNSRKEVKLSDLLRNVATTNPEVAKVIGAIDTSKPVSAEVLTIKAKDGSPVNLFDAIYKTRGLFNVITTASGDTLNESQVGSSIRDKNILGTSLKILTNATPEQKVAFINGLKEYSGKTLGVNDIANLSDAQRAKWTLARLFEERNPGILKQDVITNEDLFKLASGLNFSGTKVLEGNLKADVLKAFNHNTTLHPNSIPAAILLRINNSESLAETIKNVEDAELYVRRQNRDKMPNGWRPFLREDISARLRDIAVVQEAMGEKAAEITKDHTYQGTIGLEGLGYKENAFYNMYNLNILPKEASDNFFKANEQNPQVKNVAYNAYSNIMGIPIDGVRTGPLVNKLAVSVLSQFLPVSFAYSRDQTITDSQSVFNLPQQDLASAEKVTALAIKFTDPEFAKAYAKFISEKRTPEESLTLALGAKSDPSTGKWVVEGRNGFKLTFNNLDEFNKFSKMARQATIQVTGTESQNASSSAGVKVFENNPVASVELGGSTLTAKESEELRQYLGNEAKNYDENMVKARKMLVEAQANRDQVAAKLTSTFSANSLRQAMGLGTNGFLATHGEYKGGNKDGVISSTDNDTQANANPDDVKRYSKELNEYRSGKRTSLPEPVMAYLKMCGNLTPIFGQDIPLQASGEISTNRKTVTDVNVQRNVDKGNEELTAAVVVKPKPPEEKNEPKKEEPTPEQKELQTENTVQKSDPNSIAPGKSTNPQQTGTGVDVKAPTPSATPGGNHLNVQPAGTNANIQAPTPAVQPGANVNVQPLPQVAPQPVAPIPSNIAPPTPSIPQVTPITPNVPVVPAPAVLPQPPVDVVPVVVAPPSVPFELAPSAPTVVAPVVNAPLP